MNVPREDLGGLWRAVEKRRQEAVNIKVQPGPPPVHSCLAFTPFDPADSLPLCEKLSKGRIQLSGIFRVELIYLVGFQSEVRTVRYQFSPSPLSPRHRPPRRIQIPCSLQRTISPLVTTDSAEMARDRLAAMRVSAFSKIVLPFLLGSPQACLTTNRPTKGSITEPIPLLPPSSAPPVRVITHPRKSTI